MIYPESRRSILPYIIVGGQFCDLTAIAAAINFGIVEHCDMPSMRKAGN